MYRLIFAVILGVALVSSLAFIGLSQEKQNESVAPPKPLGPLQDEFLDWFSGDWHGQGKNFIMGFNFDEISSWRWELKHQFLVHETMTPNPQGEPFYKGAGYLTKLADSDKYVLYWFNSFRQIKTYEATIKGDTITFIHKGKDNYQEVYTYTKKGADEYRVYLEATDPKSGKLTPQFETLLKRGKK